VSFLIDFEALFQAFSGVFSGRPFGDKWLFQSLFMLEACGSCDFSVLVVPSLFGSLAQ